MALQIELSHYNFVTSESTKSHCEMQEVFNAISRILELHLIFP